MSDFKKYLFIAIFIVFLISSAKLYLNHVESVGYEKGFNVANSAWVKKAGEYKKKIDDTYEENKRLNEELSRSNQEKIKDEKAKEEKITDMQIEYYKSEKGKDVFDNNEIIDIYNESLGVK